MAGVLSLLDAVPALAAKGLVAVALLTRVTHKFVVHAVKSRLLQQVHFNYSWSLCDMCASAFLSQSKHAPNSFAMLDVPPEAGVLVSPMILVKYLCMHCFSQ